MSMDRVVITVEVVHRVVMVTLEQGMVNRRIYDFVYDQVLNLLDNLIDAEMIRWVKSRADHYMVMPARGVEPIEVATEIKRRLKL